MTFSSTTPANTALTPETLLSWISEHQDLVVIDVRSAAEFESLHIRGSYNVPLPLLSEHTEELAARLGSRVVLVCQSGARAEQARHRLNTAGIAGAYVLSGGAPGFAEAGGDVVRGGKAPLGCGSSSPPRRRLAGGLGVNRRQIRIPEVPYSRRRHRGGLDVLRGYQHVRHGQSTLRNAVE